MITAIQPRHLETIKSLALVTAGIKNITPMDCRVLSFAINQKTQLSLSETTLKRVYGFALSRFNPSLFTLNSLAVFCGYDCWDSFVKAHPLQELSPGISPSSGWQDLRARAAEASAFTLQVLKNRSGIPYRHTFPRAFTDGFFQDFAVSGEQAAVIAAPAGHGKSIALCHWVEARLNVADSDDVVLFYSSTALMSALHGNKSMEDWLARLTGLHSGADLEQLTAGRRQGLFYLVLDGIDEHMFRREQFSLLLNQLVHLAALYGEYGWFRLVLTMRSSTWQNYGHELRAADLRWFGGLPDAEPMPFFNLQELQRFDDLSGFADAPALSTGQADCFRHPLYLQFYYQQFQGRRSLSRADRVSSFELTAEFMLQRVYRGYHALEKTTLLAQIAAVVDPQDGQVSVQVAGLPALIKQSEPAYRELLASGVLELINRSTGHFSDILIRFCRPEFLDHTLARLMLAENAGVLDEVLAGRICARFVPGERRLGVLQWTMLQAFHNGQQRGLHHLLCGSLSLPEKYELVLFFGKLLERIADPGFFKEAGTASLWAYLIGPELIGPSYKPLLDLLLRFDLDPQQKMEVYMALGTTAIVNLDLRELEKQLVRLKNMEAGIVASLPFNPVCCLELVLHHLKHGEIHRKGLTALSREAARLHFSPQQIYGADRLNLLLGIYTYALFSVPAKALRFTAGVKQHLLFNHVPAGSVFYFFVQLMAADASLKSGDVVTAEMIQQELSVQYIIAGSSLPPYMETLWLSFRVKLLLRSDDQRLLAAEIKRLRIQTELSGSRLSKLYLDTAMAGNERLMGCFPDLLRDVGYDLMKMISRQGLNRELDFEAGRLAG